MSSPSDIKKLQDSLEKLHVSLNQNGVHQTNSLKDDIGILLDVLHCPVFDSILCVQVTLTVSPDFHQQSTHSSISLSLHCAAIVRAVTGTSGPSSLHFA